MGRDVKIKKYDNNSLVKLQDLGNGSYGAIQLLFHKELNKPVVGKYFETGGDQNAIKKALNNAKREANILARIKHKNIVHLIGITSRDNSFGIILEFVCCGNLENLLLNNIEIPIPWKMRARFFLEFAYALDYLHYHHPKKSFIHGDLKPQNRATAIATQTGAFSTTSMSFSGEGNTQHTPFYTAPEYLRKPTKKRFCSMDVYSYGMIGYEIITRRRVFGESQVPLDVLMYLIKIEGQKPDESLMDEISNSLENRCSDHKIYLVVKKIVQQCWQNEAKDRPKISDVKENLEELNKADFFVGHGSAEKKLVEQRNLKTKLPQLLKPGMGFALKKWIREKILKNCSRNLIILILISLLVYGLWLESDSAMFMLINGKHLKIYDTHFYLTSFTGIPPYYQETTTIQNFVKVRDMAYVISCIKDKPVIRINMSDRNSTWDEVYWNNEFKNRKYISFKDSIFAIGSQSDYMNHDCQYNYIPGSSAAYMYNTTTNIWTALPSMSEERLGAALVLYDGLICAVGGSTLPSVECFNQTYKYWISLPLMNYTIRNAAAVDFNGELYVIGGTPVYNLKEVDEKMINKHHFRFALSSVVKYNSETNLWTAVPNLIEKRSHHAASVSNGRIYVVGGSSSLVKVYNNYFKLWCTGGTLVNSQRCTRVSAADLGGSGAGNIGTSPKLYFFQLFRKHLIELRLRGCFFLRYLYVCVLTHLL